MPIEDGVLQLQVDLKTGVSSTSSIPVVVNDTSFSTHSQEPCPCASYARYWSWKTPSRIQFSIRGKSRLAGLFQKIRHLRRPRSSAVSTTHSAIMTANVKT